MNCKALAVMKSGRTLKTLLTAIVVFASMINGMAQVPSYVPANGLVGWWPFNGNANDESGNGNDGTVNGATLTSDRNGAANAAYSFDGVNDFIEILNSASLESNNISIGFWVKSSSNLFQQIIYKVTPNTAANESYSIPLNLSQAGKINFDLKNNNCNPGQGWNLFSTNVTTSNWTYIVLTHDGVNSKIYQNGQLISNNLANFNANNCQGGNLLIGATWQYSNCFNGQLDDIGIWNRALTQNEITQLYTGSPCVNYQIITVTDTLIINANLSGINPLTFQNTINVYPNPSSSQITIDFGANFNTLAGYTMRIQNAVGQTVYTTGVTQQQFTSNLNTWTGSGIYFVYLIDAQGNTVDVKKIILQ